LVRDFVKPLRHFTTTTAAIFSGIGAGVGQLFTLLAMSEREFVAGKDGPISAMGKVGGSVRKRTGEEKQYRPIMWPLT
jgi:nitrate/nitrite transporter NarK